MRPSLLGDPSTPPSVPSLPRSSHFDGAFELSPREQRSWPLWLRDDQTKRLRTASFSFLPTRSRPTSPHYCISCMQTPGYSWRRSRPDRDWTEFPHFAVRLTRWANDAPARPPEITRPGEVTVAAIWLTRRIPQRRGTVLKGEHEWPSLHPSLLLVGATRRRRTVVRTAAIVVMTRRNAGGIADATSSLQGNRRIAACPPRPTARRTL